MSKTTAHNKEKHHNLYDYNYCYLKHGKTTWNAKAVGTYRHHSTHRNTLHEMTTQKYSVKTALEIYISGQVDTLNKTSKLLYTSKVFCCGWQTIPNFNNAVSKKVLSNIYYNKFKVLKSYNTASHYFPKQKNTEKILTETRKQRTLSQQLNQS